MKKNLYRLLIFLLSYILLITSLYAYQADSIIGTWLVTRGDAKVTIYKCSDNVCGKITWLKNTDDLDAKNPDPARRGNKLLGMSILWSFTYNGSEWAGGQIYDPDSGTIYKCKMWLDDSDHLNVKGYMGVSILGRSEVWTRVK